MPIKRELFKPHYSKIMTPKPHFKKRVFELSRKLPKISKGQSNYAKVIALNPTQYVREVLYIVWSGSNWKDESELITALDGVVCPSCEKKLVMHNSYKPRTRDVE
jgi:DNA-directed RNA polymerase subunit RPC12/RpoP